MFCLVHYDSLQKREIFTYVDSMPQFPGGMKELFRFISQNMTYPSGDVITGTVFLDFIVEPTGEITHKKVRKGLSSFADGEALSILDKMPKWRPGLGEGTPVAVEYHLPIKIHVR